MLRERRGADVRRMNISEMRKVAEIVADELVVAIDVKAAPVSPARIVRPVKRTSSTKMRWRSVTSKEMSVEWTMGFGAMRERSSR